MSNKKNKTSSSKNRPLIKPQIEKVLKQIILKDLSKGRKDFDRPHTEAVVYWVKYLLKNVESLQPKIFGKNPTIDPQVLITAAYAHDWGYIGLFSNSNSNSLPKILKMKKLHMIRGAMMIERLLHQRLGRHFIQQQILRVAHLVLFHDKIKKLKDEDELLLMEADTLGMLDTNFIKPTFSKKDNANFMKKGIEGLRLPAFIHPEAKKIALKMAEKRNSFYQ